MTYHPWLHDLEDDSLARIVKTPPEIEAKDFTLNKGISVRDWFPGSVVFDFAPDYGMKLADSIPNAIGPLIVSEKLRQLLATSAGATFEFLPVELRNHKGKLVPAPYYVANLLDVVECVDKARSDFVPNRIIKNQIKYFRRLALDETRIEPQQKIFRLAERTRLLLVRNDLARLILEAGCAGVRFIPLEDYGAEYRSGADPES